MQRFASFHPVIIEVPLAGQSSMRGRLPVCWTPRQAGRLAGGKSLAEQNLASYWIDTHVSEGTNTKDEKAANLAAVFNRMSELLGRLHEETYLHVARSRATLTALAA